MQDMVSTIKRICKKMIIKEVDSMLRGFLINWLESIGTELESEKPRINLLLKEVQVMIDVLTPFPDALKAIKELESEKEGVLDPQN